ncbi:MULTISPECIES: hypothetical protein [unclassified Streptomyces]|uniref:hypothetical protein n=1 Tax=unclassified Streptomyces TaxID=2593676 RepID=UPI0037FCAD60
MNNTLSAAWAFEAEAAEAADTIGREPGRSWIPPILGVLVAAVRLTSLARLYPFTSHNRFCLSDGPQWWAGQGEIAPAFVALDPEAGFTVWRGKPYDASASMTMTTSKQEAAAAALAELLSAWPHAGPTS